MSLRQAVASPATIAWLRATSRCPCRRRRQRASYARWWTMRRSTAPSARRSAAMSRCMWHPSSMRERDCGSIGAMSDPRTAPYGFVRLAEVDTLAQVDPGSSDITDCAFHLVRRHFDVQAFGVNAATGNAGDEMVEEHHEADDEENQT